jgi:hypothetical protein
MPLFSLPVIALYPKDSYTLFSASDTLAATNVSQVITIGAPGPVPRGVMTFQMDFASSATAVVEILGSNTQPTSSAPQGGVVLYTSTNMQHDNYTDNVAFTFYWAELVSQSGGGALTLTVHVG